MLGEAALDPDGPEPAEDPTPNSPVRGELWLRDRRDGRLERQGRLDPEHGSQVRALIEQLATRHPAVDGIPDERTVEQRQADALIELCDRARATDEFPTTGGEPPHLTVTLTWETLRAGLGSATLDYGHPISATDARRMACDCKVIPVVLGGDSEPLDVGRALRTVPRGIRRALIARDCGCTFPGCHRLRCPSRPALGRWRRHERRELLPALRDASPTSAPPGLGHHHPRRARRIPTPHHHRPRPHIPHQPTPTLNPLWPLTGH